MLGYGGKVLVVAQYEGLKDGSIVSSRLSTNCQRQPGNSSEDLGLQGVSVCMAACPETVLSKLQTQSCIRDSLLSSCVFPSVHHAVQRCLSTLPKPLEELTSDATEC
ncbi:hypothetical protein JOQ06_020536 [Pogonophryne albipinna]|uniref:Uncharacterized protein n=1 Tax=Pogonophryne albipinna TaxID=1090488 RepID=A0AAD6BRN5_9TELE|nr:hypothetical protein JOQ06_020536 [Pogonophryne albipinna]